MFKSKINLKDNKGIICYYEGNGVIPEQSIAYIDKIDAAPKHSDNLIGYKYFTDKEVIENNKVVTRRIYENGTYFGTFTSIEKLIENNINGEYDTLIWNIKALNGYGIVTSPKGFKTILGHNDVVVTEQFNKNKVKTKNA